MINVIIVLSVLCSSLAQIALKKGMSSCECSFSPAASNILPLLSSLLLNPFVMTGVLLHIIALFTWLYVLKHVDVSYAYPFISMGFVIVLFLGYFLFHESINQLRVAGVVLIILGIIVVGKSATH